MAVPDALIVAIAKVNGCALATRNVTLQAPVWTSSILGMTTSERRSGPPGRASFLTAGRAGDFAPTLQPRQRVSPSAHKSMAGRAWVQSSSSSMTTPGSGLW
jgi:hypothetical protein